MSSFYDDASLVVIPSGYKTSKVYAEKPTDGSGDLAFTRTGDTATRVNSAGLIEKVRTNLYTYSQAFANAAWLTIDTTKVSTSATDPNGGTTAANVTWTAGTGRYFYQNVGTSNIATVSFYVKSNGGGNNFRFFANGATSFSANLTATSTWTRYSFSFTGTGAVGVGITNASDNSAANLLFAFAQLETGDIATDYIPTTTAAVSVGPVANVPRLDYLGSTCPRLLLEPQRTNSALYSEQFNNAAWSKNQSTISINSATSPDGNMSADKLVEDSSNAFHDINQLPFSTTGGQTYTFSIFVKPDTRSKIRIGYGALVNFDAFGGDVFAIIDVSNKSVISSVLSPTILFSDFENGYVRVTFLKQATGSGQFNLIFGLVNNSNAASYLGDGSSGLFIWGAQVEAGAYATSYIPTLAASATRGADAASKTGISSLIGQTEGTLFMDVNKTLRTDSPVRLNISDGTASNWIFIGLQTNNSPILYVITAGANVVNIAGVALSNGRHKIAGAYKNNDFVLYVDGVQIGTDTSGDVGATSRFQYGGNYLDTAAESDSLTNQILLFKTRLTNAEMQELTTL
jgi:hypothetical protein